MCCCFFASVYLHGNSESLRIGRLPEGVSVSARECVFLCVCVRADTPVLYKDSGSDRACGGRLHSKGGRFDLNLRPSVELVTSSGDRGPGHWSDVTLSVTGTHT